MAKCRLCNNERELCDSHIIPKGLLKISKGKYSQLIALTDNKKPRWDNVNWNEELLCKDCEEHINLYYETKQISLLKSRKLGRQTGVTITGFDFERFYLFWVSIFWRAAESSLPHFNSVQLPPEFLVMLKEPIRAGGLHGDYAFLPDLLQVGVSRWMMKDVDTKSVISSFSQFDNNGSLCFMFLVSGLAIIYQLSDKPFSRYQQGLA